jgi:hypothetical protein
MGRYKRLFFIECPGEGLHLGRFSLEKRRDFFWVVSWGIHKIHPGDFMRISWGFHGDLMMIYRFHMFFKHQFYGAFTVW